MELIKYIGKVVKVDLKNGYFYTGTVEKADDSFISLIDRNGKWVDISESMISFIVEVGE